MRMALSLSTLPQFDVTVLSSPFDDTVVRSSRGVEEVLKRAPQPGTTT